MERWSGHQAAAVSAQAAAHELSAALTALSKFARIGVQTGALCVGAWLATSAAIAAGIYQLTGNVFYGIGSVAIANIVGALIVVHQMRGCWRDLALPRTRRAIAEFREPSP